MDMRAEVPAIRSRRGRHLRRLYVGTLIAGTFALVAGVAFALSNTTLNGTVTVGIGSVSLTGSASSSCPVSYPGLVPGDTANALGTCQFTFNYTGSLPAYMSLTVQVQSKAGIGGTTLFDGTSTGLQVSVSDGTTSYSTPPATGTTTCTPSGGYTACWVESNDLTASSYPSSVPDLNFGPGHSNAVTFTVMATLPSGAKNQYQGGAASVTLTAQAVQAGANTLPAACNESTVGQPCSSSAGPPPFAWS